MTLPVVRENLNIVEKNRCYFRTKFSKDSGWNVVWALLELRLASSFSTPFVVIVIDGDFGKGLYPTFGRGRLLVEKTDEYCSFRMSALPFE